MVDREVHDGGRGIPGSWDEVTPAWMTWALSSACPGAEVEAVELVTRDDGTNRRARFALRYRSGSGPETVFVKAADPEHAQLNARTGGVFNEPRLFLSDVELPVDHPQVYRSLIDEAKLDFLLVMEDVTRRGADPRDSTRPLNVAQAADGVRGLARLHSRYWGERLAAHPGLGWVEPFVPWTGMYRGIGIGIDGAQDLLPPELRTRTGPEVEAHWMAFMATLGDGPPTLLHGDAHIGNTYTLPGDRLGFLDWQVLRRGHGSLDLGYFLQGALTVEDRRAHEADLVDEYLDALDLPAEERPDRDDLWLRYRGSVAHGLAIWLATSALPTWQPIEVSLALVERYAAAFVDLDTAAAIDALRRR